MNTYQTTNAPRRIFALLLALCLALALVPGMEMRVEAAGGEPPELTATIYLKEGGEGWGLYYTAGATNDTGAIDKITPDPENPTLGGGQYSYDPTGVDGSKPLLTLTNVNVSTTARIALDTTDVSGLTITLVGENSLVSTYSGTSMTEGLNANSLTITGSGSLTVTGGTSTNDQTAGLRAAYYSVTVEGGATVIATTGNASVQADGIYVGGSLTVKGGATVTATGGTATGGSSHGIYSKLTVDGGTVTATGGIGSNGSYGIGIALPANLGLIVTSGTVIARGNTQAVNATASTAATAYRMWSSTNNEDISATTAGTEANDTSITVTGKKFIRIDTVAGVTQSQILYLNTTDGTLRLNNTSGTKAKSGTNYTGRYSYADGTLTLDNFHLTNTVARALDVSSASSLIIELVGENSIANTRTGYSSQGIRASNLTITGSGTLTVTSTSSGGADCIGVDAASVTVEDGATLTATSSSSTSSSYGIKGNLTITRGTVKLESGAAPESKPWSGTTFSVPESGYCYKINSGAWTAITSGTFTATPTTAATLEIAPMPAQTQELRLNADTGILELFDDFSDNSGEEAMPGVNYTGSYDYDNTEKVLTLTNFNFTTSAAQAMEVSDISPLTIELVGENSLESTFSGSATSNGLYAKVLTITGSGSLVSTGGTATGGGSSNGVSIYNGSLTITGGAEVTATGGDGHYYSQGIAANTYLVTVTGGATLTATGGTSNQSDDAYGSYGIRGNLTVTGGTVTASGDKAAVTGSVTLPTPYIWWINTTTANPGGAGTKSNQTTYAHNTVTTKFLKIAPLTLSTDATLSALTVSAGGETLALDKPFAPGTLGYSASVANMVEEVTIDATVAATGLATIDGDTGTQDLEVGNNNIFTITVTAENGATQDYTIQITRAAQGTGDNPGNPGGEPGGGDPGENPEEPVAPTVTPAALSLTAGTSGTLHLTLGTSYTGATISSSDLSVATVSPASVSAAGDVQVNGVAAGNVVITITFTGGTPAYSIVVPVIVSAARSPFDPPIYSDPSDDGSGDSGGGSSPDSASPPPNTPTPVTPQQADDAAQDAVDDATEKGSDTANVKLKNPGEIGVDILEIIEKATRDLPGGAKLMGDSYTADGKAVDVRIKLDVGEAIEDLKSGVIKTLNLAASTTNTAAKQVKKLFEAWYSNDIQTVHFEMQGSWGQPVEVAAKLDSALATTNLVFYSYNKAANTYTRIVKPGYWVDKNGYVHFTTEVAGDIIISEGALVRR